MHNSMIYGVMAIELRKMSTKKILAKLARTTGGSQNPMFSDDASHIRSFLLYERNLTDSDIDRQLALLKK